MRMTLGEQLQQMNDKNTELQNNMNTLVQQANERIQEEINERVRLVKAAEDNAAEEIAKAKKEVETAKGNSKYYSERNLELTKQIETLHEMIDLIPDVLPRYKDGDKYNEYPLASRLMSYFVTRSK